MFKKNLMFLSEKFHVFMIILIIALTAYFSLSKAYSSIGNVFFVQYLIISFIFINNFLYHAYYVRLCEIPAVSDFDEFFDRASYAGLRPSLSFFHGKKNGLNFYVFDSGEIIKHTRSGDFITRFVFIFLLSYGLIPFYLYEKVAYENGVYSYFLIFLFMAYLQVKFIHDVFSCYFLSKRI